MISEDALDWLENHKEIPMNECNQFSGAYVSALNDAEAAMRDWMHSKGITAESGLPLSVWDLPKDCPLWSMGLSLAQAAAVFAAAKAGKYAEASP